MPRLSLLIRFMAELVRPARVVRREQFRDQRGAPRFDGVCQARHVVHHADVCFVKQLSAALPGRRVYFRGRDGHKHPLEQPSELELRVGPI
jgi:hypothetical protein